VLVVSFVGTSMLALVLAGTYEHMVPLTIACLTMAVCLGLGTGAVFKLVPQWYPDRVGAVTGVVGAAGGLGGFFPPVVMGIVKDHFDTYALGFIGLLLFAAICFAVALTMRRATQVPRGVAA
jgi:NNP family nitrate/nitrite transporter-like MFS transporter